MVISVLEHGLGNQLFQYAAGRAVADRLKTTLLLDKMRFRYNRTRTWELGRFRLRARTLPDRVAAVLSLEASAPGGKGLLGRAVAGVFPTYEDGQKGYDPTIFDGRGHRRLDGFWQSERYFRPLRPQLLEELEPRRPLPAASVALARRLAGEPSVAVHVRRGDVARGGEFAATVGALAVGYYAQALAWFAERMPDARFYVFTDDPSWCEQNLPRVARMEVVSRGQEGDAVQDLTLMKHCRHFLVSNSTFSWWAAWLGNDRAKQVLAPARFFRVPGRWERDLLPPEWNTLEPAWEDIG